MGVFRILSFLHLYPYSRRTECGLCYTRVGVRFSLVQRGPSGHLGQKHLPCVTEIVTAASQR